jgi:hypothetical protein
MLRRHPPSAGSRTLLAILTRSAGESVRRLSLTHSGSGIDLLAEPNCDAEPDICDWIADHNG